MQIVIKLGGSLSNHRKSLFNLCQALAKIGSQHQVIIVPGGGAYANLVRADYMRFNLSEKAAHHMAIHAMTQYGYLLHTLIPNSRTFLELEQIVSNANTGISIWLPHHQLLLTDYLPNSWDVTSDSIAAYATSLLNWKFLILLKDQDGIYTFNPAQNQHGRLLQHISSDDLPHYKIVDPMFNKYLKKNTCCWIINGHYPHRLTRLLAAGTTLGTEIS